MTRLVYVCIHTYKYLCVHPHSTSFRLIHLSAAMSFSHIMHNMHLGGIYPCWAMRQPAATYIAAHLHRSSKIRTIKSKGQRKKKATVRPRKAHKLIGELISEHPLSLWISVDRLWNNMTPSIEQIRCSGRHLPHSHPRPQRQVQRTALAVGARREQKATANKKATNRSERANEGRPFSLKPPYSSLCHSLLPLATHPLPPSTNYRGHRTSGSGIFCSLHLCSGGFFCRRYASHRSSGAAPHRHRHHPCSHRHHPRVFVVTAGEGGRVCAGR